MFIPELVSKTSLKGNIVCCLFLIEHDITKCVAVSSHSTFSGYVGESWYGAYRSFVVRSSHISNLFVFVGRLSFVFLGPRLPRFPSRVFRRFRKADGGRFRSRFVVSDWSCER